MAKPIQYCKVKKKKGKTTTTTKTCLISYIAKEMLKNLKSVLLIFLIFEALMTKLNICRIHFSTAQSTKKVIRNIQTSLI